METTTTIKERCKDGGLEAEIIVLLQKIEENTRKVQNDRNLFFISDGYVGVILDYIPTIPNK